MKIITNRQKIAKAKQVYVIVQNSQVWVEISKEQIDHLLSELAHNSEIGISAELSNDESLAYVTVEQADIDQF